MVKKKIDPSAPDAGDFGRPEKRKWSAPYAAPTVAGIVGDVA